MPTETIELARCRSAWKAFFKENNLPEDAITFEDGSPIYAWCLHHETRSEPLYQPIWSRINYILSEKPGEDHAIRFLNLRPVSKGHTARVEEACNVYRAAGDVAYQVYDAACTEVEKVYEAAGGGPFLVYNPTMADVYAINTTIVAEARKVYDAAMDEVKGTLNASLADLHILDVPNHTWNGKSIF